ncbi:MAG: hypothetical protein M5U34_18080 [Chloroflexi bacterium]|nr:hypothetical protein [Chloroflexota bacterium]
MAMALMGLCLTPTFLFLLVRGADGNVFNFGREPTPFATSVSSSISANTSIVQGIGPSDTVSVTLDIPATLTINGRSHSVQPQVIPADGAWNPDLDEAEAAWVFGTVINYVFGLPNTQEARSLLESMGPGDEFEMITQNGIPFVFRLTAWRWFHPTTGIFTTSSHPAPPLF